jgi:hypothetical protein
MRALRLPIAHSGCLFGSLPPPTASSYLVSAAALPQRSRQAGGGLLGQGLLLLPATLRFRQFVRGRDGISQVSRRSFPCLCSAPRPRSNRCSLAKPVTSMLPPRPTRRRLQQGLISGLTHAASAHADLRFAFRVTAHAQGSLPAGWLAFTGRASNPLDRDERFQLVLTIIPLSCSPDASGLRGLRGGGCKAVPQSAANPPYKPLSFAEASNLRDDFWRWDGAAGQVQ